MRERPRWKLSHCINQTWKWQPTISAILGLSEENQYVQPTLKGCELHQSINTKMWWSWGAPFQAVCQTLLDHLRIFRRNLAKAQEERKLEILLATVFATNHQAKTKKKKKRREVNLLVKCPFKCHLFKAAIFTIYSVVPPPITRYSTTLFDFHHYMIYSYLFAYWLFFSSHCITTSVKTGTLSICKLQYMVNIYERTVRISTRTRGTSDLKVPEMWLERSGIVKNKHLP